MEKINSDGQYLPFYGVTVISFIKMTEKLIDFHKYMCSKTNFLKCYKPSPIESYHVTLKSIIDSKQGPTEFMKQILCSMKEIIDLNEACKMLRNNIGNTIDAKGCGFFVGKTFGLDLKILNPENVLPIDILDQHHAPHITFCYRYYEDNQADCQIYSAVNDDIKDIIEYFNKNILNDDYILQFGMPFVCTFNNMLHFNPIE